jgi:hypothetical protein
MATKQIDISKYSVGEFSYILNSYIEESFTDVKIQYMMMERNNIVDGPFGLFNEADNNAAKNGILEKIKTIVRNVLNAIASIFEKIGDAIRNIISNISSLRVRRLNDRYKKFINEVDDKTFSKIVEDNVTEWGDARLLQAYIKSVIDDMPNDLPGIKAYIGNIRKTVENYDDIVKRYYITDKSKISSMVKKEDMLDIMFSEGRKAFIELGNIKKELDKEMKKEEESITASIDDKFTQEDANISIECLKLVAKLSVSVSKTVQSFMISNSKQLVKVAHALEHEFNSRNKLKT